MKRSNLTLEAVKNIRQVGSIASSSIFLAKKILKGIDFDQKLTILELGAGTGVITKEILNQMSDSSTLYSYENNENLVDLLHDIGDSRLIVKGECVSTLRNMEDGFFDIVISSLPLALFNNEFKDSIYKDIRSKLKTGGTFVQYQYSLSDYKGIEKMYNNCKVEFCLLNLPPAFIYKVQAQPALATVLR